MTEEVYLDPVKHVYIERSTGRHIRSVSSILRKAKIREAIPAGAGKSDALAKALVRGRDVHRLARSMDETYDLDDALADKFDPADVTPENLNYVASYDLFLRISGYVPLAWEAVVYHPEYDYAGRVDAVGWLGTKRIMVDRKTERSLHRAVWLQLAAYREAWNRVHPNEKIDQTFALVLRDNMSFDLKPNPLEPADFPFFVAACWLERWHSMAL